MGSLTREAADDAAPKTTEQLGFGRYAVTHLAVARSRPGVVEGATERRRAEVMTALGIDRRAYLEIERAIVEEALDADPWAVLDAGDHADVLLCGYASKVAHDRHVAPKPAEAPVERFNRRVRERAAKAAKKVAA